MCRTAMAPYYSYIISIVPLTYLKGFLVGNDV